MNMCACLCECACMCAPTLRESMLYIYVFLCVHVCIWICMCVSMNILHWAKKFVQLVDKVFDKVLQRKWKISYFDLKPNKLFGPPNIYVYVYGYGGACVCVWTCICMNVYVYAYEYGGMDVYVCGYMCVWICTVWIHVCECVYINIFACTYLLTVLGLILLAPGWYCSCKCVWYEAIPHWRNKLLNGPHLLTYIFPLRFIQDFLYLGGGLK